MKTIVSYISRYRTCLMGIAILGVMLAHCKMEWPISVFSRLVGFFCYSVFTGGFFFLSGFGLYFSLEKDSNLKHFYLKRIKRFIIPWILIATPYFIITDLFWGNGLSDFLFHISTLAFWVHGNYSGMWYISVILVLYLIYPIYHAIAYKSKSIRRSHSILILTISFLLICEIVLSIWASDYYERIKICSSMSIFFIGSYFASFSSSEKENSYGYVLTRGVYCSEYAFIDIVFQSLRWHLLIIFNIISIQFWALSFHYIEKSKPGSFLLSVLEWLGTYTLELYMLHLFFYYLIAERICCYVSNSILFPISVGIAIALCSPIHKYIDRISTSLFHYYGCEL